jgi:hypothetical protein
VVEWPLITGCNRWNPKAPAATFTITLGAGDGADSKGNAAVQRAVRPCTKAWRLSPVERPQKQLVQGRRVPEALPTNYGWP